MAFRFRFFAFCVNPFCGSRCLSWLGLFFLSLSSVLDLWDVFFLLAGRLIFGLWDLLGLWGVGLLGDRGEPLKNF